MKALLLLKSLRKDDVSFGATKEDLKVFDEAIEELERLLRGSCQGCVFDTKDLYSANCEYCSRMREDNYTPKEEWNESY